MTKSEASTAFVTVTNALQLQLSALDRRKRCMVEANATLSRIDAQRLAHALLEFAGALSKRKSAGARKLTVPGVFRPDAGEDTVVFFDER